VTGRRSVMLVKAWRKHLEMHGEHIERGFNESRIHFLHRSKPLWGLCEHVAEGCRFRNRDGEVVGTVDRLIIEAKASGITAVQEMQRLYADEGWATKAQRIQGDKVARAYAVVPAFSAGLVYTPGTDWADMVMTEMQAFPKGKYDDLTDSATMALQHLRTAGLLMRPEEVAREESEALKWKGHREPLYEI